ncbi:DUF397 domain-containing protein [Actinokineospora bangkokensis]|uniref:DUF397 domain-containing protein n=1 Tax=Actinokineospora bangkokensis TaxID=1193682 RepID=A0A1Q9LH54_9PSEU|nr:DUF397 domain-containing protein [Actinokineospora bangkokensis]OLR91353.1 hypothetical protein BJP25_27215 [Actinokineospora bangkokensis]
MVAFRKSSRCSNGSCVEVRVGPHVVEVRGVEPSTVLTIPYTGAWQGFLRSVKATGRGGGPAA